MTELEKLKEMHEGIFGVSVPILAFTEVPDDKLVELLKDAIYNRFEPLTLEDLSPFAGDADIV